MSLAAFAGIDVACAKSKRLPIVICRQEDARLVPLPLRDFRDALPPKAQGNRGALSPEVVRTFALETLEYLRAVETAYRLRIKRIAIDAPSCYKRDGISRRAADLAMYARGISCFATPNRQEFEEIKIKATTYLAGGGSENRIPHANQLWMLVGFTLFDVLGKCYDCIEVFPQAIADVLQARKVHKSKREGITLQLSAVAKYSGWPVVNDLIDLNQIAFGSRHDKLDAYLSAWVASLSENECLPCGEPPNDVIWIPRVPRCVS